MIAGKPRVWPGEPYPLGATWDGKGVNFGLFSENAEKVELCLFDDQGERELHRIALPEYTDEVWHGYFPDLRPGQIYGYRVFGPYNPRQGHRFNHHKLLLDPYAKAMHGRVRWHDACFGYRVGDAAKDLSFDERDSAPYMPKCRVVDTAFTWGDDQPPRRPWHETVIYEMHVRGFTMRREDVPHQFRGTFTGLAQPHVIEYLASLGVSAVELMPIHGFVDDRHLVEANLRNYWGYNSIAFFAPAPHFMSSTVLGEFKTMIKLLHEAGIEVLLDVVYNHTAEGNELGPTLSFRGIDNATYYQLDSEGRHYVDFTGCGNALKLHHPRVLQLVMDSLRYWVEEMHVDGFRFDLAPTLAREDGAYDQHSGFLDAVLQDPVLSHVKLIAEPWDVGPGGYQLGGFPPGWAEWNDRYRDTVRRFWKGDEGQLADLASRITGSSDVFERRGRRPWASINFVTSHDGFTLRDLVSFNQRHNEANNEGNRDGHDHNFGWNCGTEGPTDDPAIRGLRARQARNFLATLLLSQGVPMITAGDELGRTQQGNNNAYCQDNELSWLDWSGVDNGDAALVDFVRRLIELRRSHIVLHRQRFFHGRSIPGTAIKDITWLRPDGFEMRERDWRDVSRRSLGFLLSGEAGHYHVTAQGEPEHDDTFLVLMNAGHEDISFKLPATPSAGHWEPLLDTGNDAGNGDGREIPFGADFPLGARTLVVFVRRSHDGNPA